MSCETSGRIFSETQWPHFFFLVCHYSVSGLWLLLPNLHEEKTEGGGDDEIGKGGRHIGSAAKICKRQRRRRERPHPQSLETTPCLGFKQISRKSHWSHVARVETHNNNLGKFKVLFTGNPERRCPGQRQTGGFLEVTITSKKYWKYKVSYLGTQGTQRRLGSTYFFS